ncbi:MAG: hypothetical protein KAV00_01990 [Phycisphaerae bacterium]|nr:hypothetical protein [Phycisphaerae bacterium]
MATNDDRERLYDGPKRRLKRDLLTDKDKEWFVDMGWLAAGFGDDMQDAQDVGTQLIVHTGDDVGGTGFFPSIGRVARRLGGALLSFLRVQR